MPEDVKKEKGLWEKTRKSLIERLNNWEDQRTWNEFYQTYWRLIFSVASKAGLTREESFDVIQETIIAIARLRTRSTMSSRTMASRCATCSATGIGTMRPMARTTATATPTT